jgi:DNA replication protein DnaC
MDRNPLDAATDTKAEKELAAYVAENRQHLPPLPETVVTTPVPEPESDADRAARELQEAKRAELRRRAELHERFGALVMAAGARYRGCTLDNFDCTTTKQHAIVDLLREYVVADFSCSVVLYGPVGTGKDHLAFALCKAAIRAGYKAKWVNGQQWFGTVRDAMDTEKTEASLIGELSHPELLCLSDPLPPFGSLTPFQATMLYRLVDARYSRGVPTICTVNVNDDAEADERIGEPTWDRLCHDAYKLYCNWPTFRRPTKSV